MNKKHLVLAILSILVVAIELIFFAPKGRTYSKIYLEINPQIEIEVDEDKVISVTPLNEDAKEIVSDLKENTTLDDLYKDIVEKLVDKGYTADNKVTILLHVSSDLDVKSVENGIKKSFGEKEIEADTIVIDKVSKEDEKFAEEHGISSYKAAFLNSIKEENKDIDIEKLVDKPIKELEETRLTGNTCDDGYTLEGDRCFKEIERIEAKQGNVCPRGYMEYKGKCYEETRIVDGDNYICHDDFTLENGKCYKRDIRDALPKCENGTYHSEDGSCYEQVYIGDAYEYCRDSGRTLYDHKCLATKPTINGGCLNGDMLYNGKCVNTRNDYYVSEWMCPNGKTNSNPNGELINKDNKCYEEKKGSPATFYCDDDSRLEGKMCVNEQVLSPEKERVCPSGFTKVENDRCINMNNIKEYESGLVCDKENARVVGNVCIVYEVKEANHN